MANGRNLVGRYRKSTSSLAHRGICALHAHQGVTSAAPQYHREQNIDRVANRVRIQCSCGMWRVASIPKPSQRSSNIYARHVLRQPPHIPSSLRLGVHGRMAVNSTHRHATQQGAVMQSPNILLGFGVCVFSTPSTARTSLTGRSSRRQYWPWLRHFIGQYWYPPHLRCSGAAYLWR